MRHVSYVNFVMASLTMESLWLSGRASEREISIPHGDSEFFFFVPLSWQDEIHLSLREMLFLMLTTVHYSTSIIVNKTRWRLLKK